MGGARKSVNRGGNPRLPLPHLQLADTLVPMSASTPVFMPLNSPRTPGNWIFAEESGRAWLEKEVLPGWLVTRRWFGGKARRIVRTQIEAAVPVGQEAQQVLAVRVEYAEGPADRYAIPLGWARLEEIDGADASVIAIGGENRDVAVHDAVYHPGFRAALLDPMRSDSAIRGDGGAVSGQGGSLLKELDSPDLANSRVLGVEQSNSSIIYDGQLFLKLFRRLHEGINPDAEITRYFSEQGHFGHVPAFGGELLLRLDGGEAMPFGLMLGCVDNRGDAWAWALGRLRSQFAQEDSAANEETLARIGQLGQRTAELHCALAAPTDDEAFQPEPLSAADFRDLSTSVSARLDALCRALEGRSEPLAGEVLAHAAELRTRIAALAQLSGGTVKTRHHGDYHLGQVLETGADWVIIDFEGEPTRSLAERRAKRSPLRDVAGMLRSLHYAAHCGRPDAEPASLAAAEKWADQASSVFLERYFATAAGAAFLPAQAPDRDALLAAYLLEKALYEVDYELNNRPDWLPIPLRGVLRVLGAAS